MRRSGRVPKEVPILLLGTDANGRVFSENTKTVVLSRHGAGILSRYAFLPDESLTIRFPDSGKEAEVRLVGKMGDTVRGHIYGVEFREAKVNFWGMDFPGAESRAAPVPVALECSICHEQENVQQTEIESDVYLAADGFFRYCAACGQTTRWRKASVPKPVVEQVRRPLEIEIQLVPPGDPTEEGAPDVEERGERPVIAPSSPPIARSTALLDRPVAARPENRRKHLRTRVTFKASVRVPGEADETVECENASKGGLCFRSEKRYVPGSRIEVAAPYSPGEMAIFLTAVIKWREELLGAASHRYGIAYEKAGTAW